MLVHCPRFKSLIKSIPTSDILDVISNKVEVQVPLYLSLCIIYLLCVKLLSVGASA